MDDSYKEFKINEKQELQLECATLRRELETFESSAKILNNFFVFSIAPVHNKVWQLLREKEYKIEELTQLGY